MPGGGRGEGRVRERTKLVWLPADADLWLDRLIAAVALTGFIILTSWMTSVLIRRTGEMQHEQPTTAVHMRAAENLPFPAITVCNMAPHVPLERVWCGSYVSNATTRCAAVVPPGMPHCLAFNNHLNGSLYTTEKTGLADTLMIMLRIHRDKYPPTSRFVGVHVSLHPQCEHGKTCPQELSNVLLASPGQPKFFRMRRLTQTFLNGTSDSQFEARDTVSGVSNFSEAFGDPDQTVVMGFHYGSMTETVISELPRYSLLDLGAELGGIMGLVFGTGAFDVMMHLLRWCAGRGSLYHDLTGRHPSQYRPWGKGGKGGGDGEDSRGARGAAFEEDEEAAAAGAAAAEDEDEEGSTVAAGRAAAAGAPPSAGGIPWPAGGASGRWWTRRYAAWLRRGASVPRACAAMDECGDACCPRQCYASRATALAEAEADRRAGLTGGPLPPSAAHAEGTATVRGRDADILTLGPGAERAGWWPLLCCCAVQRVAELEPRAPGLRGAGGVASGGASPAQPLLRRGHGDTDGYSHASDGVFSAEPREPGLGDAGRIGHEAGPEGLANAAGDEGGVARRGAWGRDAAGEATG